MNAIDRSVSAGTTVEKRPVMFVDDDRGRMQRVLPWTAACLVTLVVHVGVYWFLTYEREVSPPSVPEQPAAVMIDMSPEVQQAFSQTDDAVGQPMQEAVATPPPPVDPTQDLIPPAEDSPTPPVAPLPPKPLEKPKVQPKKKPLETKTTAQQQSAMAAKRTASAPRSDSHAQRTSASSAGAASARQDADWSTRARAAIEREKRRPAGSDALGAPVLRIQVSASGAVAGVSIVASSGSSDLDEAARDAVDRASPLPAPPNGAQTLTVRIVFNH